LDNEIKIIFHIKFDYCNNVDDIICYSNYVKGRDGIRAKKLKPYMTSYPKN